MCTCGMLNIIRIIFFLKNGKFKLLRLQNPHVVNVPRIQSHNLVL